MGKRGGDEEENGGSEAAPDGPEGPGTPHPTTTRHMSGTASSRLICWTAIWSAAPL
jgi:hypothetical protein